MPLNLDQIRQSWIRKELTLDSELERGSRGGKVWAVQEWLNLHGAGTGIDGDFGAGTERAVRDFQTRQGLSVSGKVDQSTWDALIGPLVRAITPIAADGQDLPALVVAYARQHLAQSPREVGGENSGPWVRVYMGGKQGSDWPWCAGFVTTALTQACESLGIAVPFGSVSCDSLAGQAKQLGIFVAENKVTETQMPAGSIFLNRRTPSDWTHTGIVTRFGAETFDTIEGNTNDEGSREGFEVCARFRGYPTRDFINLAKWKAGLATATAAAAGAKSKVTITVTAPKAVIVKVSVTNKTDNSPPQVVDLKDGAGNISLARDTPYLLNIELQGSDKFTYSVNLETAAPYKIVSRDGEYPARNRKSPGARDTFQDNFEVARQ